MIYKRNKLRVIFEDKDILVIHKNAGVASETRRIGEQDCVSLAKNYLADRQRAENPGKQGKAPWVALVHRLDQPVEGILVLAKNSKAAAILSEQIKKGEMYKEYMTLVLPEEGIGLTSGESVHLTDFLLKDAKTNTSKAVDEGTPDAKCAELEYEVVDEENPFSESGARLLKIHLLTGRHHQIRVQLSHAGLPVIGDRKYGAMPEGYRGALCLAARKLVFRHPGSGKEMTFELETSEIDFMKKK